MKHPTFALAALLPLLWVRPAAAGPEGPSPGAGLPSPGGLGAVAQLSWSEVGFHPGGPEEAAWGPDHLAVGPAGLWAVADPVNGRVRTSAGTLDAPSVSDLAFTPEGDVLVYDAHTRSLSRFHPEGARVASVGTPALAPVSLSLAVEGGAVWGEDVFGNRHPLASLAGGLGAPVSSRLERPAHRVTLQGGVVALDGRALGSGADIVGARLLGGWVLVDRRAGDHVTREAWSTSGPARAALPLDGAPYRAADGYAVAPDGALWWLDPTDAGLSLRRVR